MAVRVTRELVCDVCGKDGPTVSRYHIQRASDKKKVSPDLCGDHAAFLESIYARLPVGKRGQTRAREVLSEAEVRARRRTPAKKAPAKKAARKRA